MKYVLAVLILVLASCGQTVFTPFERHTSQPRVVAKKFHPSYVTVTTSTVMVGKVATMKTNTVVHPARWSITLGIDNYPVYTGESLGYTQRYITVSHEEYDRARIGDSWGPTLYIQRGRVRWRWSDSDDWEARPDIWRECTAEEYTKEVYRI